MFSNTVNKRAFFRDLQDLEQQADLRGAEAGLHRLDGNAFENLARGRLRQVAESAAVPSPGPDVSSRRLEDLCARKQTIDARKHAFRQRWGPPDGAATSFEVNWHRFTGSLLLAALVGFSLHLAGLAPRWETWAVLAVSGALFGLGPWGAGARALRAAVVGLELAGHLLDCARSARLHLRILSHEAAVRRLEAQRDILEGWQEMGMAVVMSRFCLHQERGALAAGNSIQQEE